MDNKNTIQKYLKNTLKTYASSFKSKDIILVLTINLLFVLITAALIKLTKLISAPWLEKINKIDLSSIASQSEAQLQSIISTLKGFALFTLLTAVLLILLLIVNWSFCQGIIYNILSKKRFSFKYFEKFLLLNLIWLIPWIILIFIFLFGAKIESVVLLAWIMISVFLHFSFILYILFTKNNKLREIKDALKTGITKFHYFIMPYSLAVTTFIIISQLNLLKINYLIIALIYALFFSWLQIYTQYIVFGMQKI